MERTAPSFFTNLNAILHSYILLEFFKITDPVKTGKNENFTVDNLVRSIDWPPDTQEKLSSLSDKTKNFRGHLLGARNKLLAHTDKEIFLAERTLGKFPEGEDEVFLKTLQDVCDITHEACFGSIFGVMVMAMPGDVIDFKRALENAVAFNRNNDAIEAYRQALRIDPELAGSWFGLGLAYALSGNKSAAMEAVKKLRRLDPARADELFNLIVPR